MQRMIEKSRMMLIILLQAAIVVVSLWAAFAVRFDFNLPPSQLSRFYSLLPALLIIKLGVFWWQGLFRGWWRYVSMADLVVIIRANVIASLLFLLYAFLAYRGANIPRSVLVLDWVFCFLLMGGVRFLTRALREHYLPMPARHRQPRSRLLVVGAGDAGQMIAREIRLNPALNLEIVGFVDDDPRKRKQSFQGFPVLGKIRRIGRICQEQGVDEIVIAIPSATGKDLRHMVELCQATGVKFKTLPGVGQLIDGKISIQQVKDVELEDLLGREPVKLDLSRIEAFLRGKRVLVTGAGGSIGSEICRQVARFQPKKIVLFENAETPLFQIERELRMNFPDLRIVPIIGDIRFKARVEAIFDEFLPEVVFHAAAYKHVPMMECNPAEAANNNVRGTRILADAAHQFGTERFVMISTDKAVNPTNVMGASKRAAELYVQALAKRSRTSFVTVRFGNVLGSNGSVIPVFKEQIAKGGPVTVTHPEVTRFFMTIPEASQLVLQAGSMGKGGEIFLLDMGEPVKIVKLAEELIQLSGYRPYEDIEIIFTGLRPGEKLYEELLLAGEGVQPTCHEKIMVARAAECDETVLVRQIEELYQLARSLDLDGVVAKLQEMVPEFQPTSPGRIKSKPQLQLVKDGSDGV
ncbi:MAG: nucleoside-diphosphate sugar epimerase/dehydratase [Trichloromonas sp.]|jgi:FlaA1/EpsC-like NDP-sugar epimerase|nr:nucleoside-diphosphate sugar epimerase/dehydratase [Trichloromonas sp.]